MTMAEIEDGRMTAAVLQKLLRSDEKIYFRTPSLNTALYVHRKGFKNLGGLEEFTGLRVIYADGNDLVGSALSCLNDNCIREVPSLGFLSALRVLNLSNNYIQKVQGLGGRLALPSPSSSSSCLCARHPGLYFLSRLLSSEQCAFLETLLLSGNRIGCNGAEDFTELKSLSSLSVLDLQRNCISQGDEFLAVAKQMPSLKVLYLQENECVSDRCKGGSRAKSSREPGGTARGHCKVFWTQTKTTLQYRKRFIHELPGLNFLDNAPVRDSSKRLAAAFFRGGREEERAEQMRIKNEETEYRRRLHRDFLRLREEARRRGRADGPAAVYVHATVETGEGNPSLKRSSVASTRRGRLLRSFRAPLLLQLRQSLSSEGDSTCCSTEEPLLTGSSSLRSLTEEDSSTNSALETLENAREETLEPLEVEDPDVGADASSEGSSQHTEYETDSPKHAAKTQDDQEPPQQENESPATCMSKPEVVTTEIFDNYAQHEL